MARGIWKSAAMLVAISVLAMGVAPPAHAQSGDTWEFQALVYAYVPDIGGTTRFPAGDGGTTITVPSDAIVDSLDFAFMATFEARKGRYGVFTDVMYLDAGGSSTGSRDISIGGQQIPAAVTADLELDLKATSWTLAGEYALVDTPRSTLHALAGARLLDMEQDLRYRLDADVGPLAGPGRSGEVAVSSTYWDAVVGLKGQAALGQDGRWSLPYYADVGTGESELTWQVFGGVGYRFDWGSVLGGWRHVAYDFKSGSKVESLDLDGPMLGVSFNW